MAKVAETVAKVQADAEDEEISPQDAAAILKMSRPSVMRLIEKRLLPAHKVHSHNRLSRADVIAYRDKQAEVRRHAMAELAAIAEEYDFLKYFGDEARWRGRVLDAVRTFTR